MMQLRDGIFSIIKTDGFGLTIGMKRAMAISSRWCRLYSRYPRTYFRGSDNMVYACLVYYTLTRSKIKGVTTTVLVYLYRMPMHVSLIRSGYSEFVFAGNP